MIQHGPLPTARRPAFIESLQQWIANPSLLALLVGIDLFAYAVGMTGWYGPVLRHAATPVWSWPFIPDCPFFGLLGGLALAVAGAERFWTPAAHHRLRHALLGAGAAILSMTGVLLLTGNLPEWSGRGSLPLLLALGMLLCGAWRTRMPGWLVALLAVGQIKYGLWTITAWSLFWRNTNALYGAPLITPESIAMTVSHIALIAQGLLLLSFARPGVTAALAVLAWFGFSDFVDYGLGWYPALPGLIPLDLMRGSTIAVTWVLGLGLLAAWWRMAASPAAAGDAPSR